MSGSDQQASAVLEEELQNRRGYADRVAFRLDRSVNLVWWGALIFAGLASILGFIADIPEVRQAFVVEPWMVSALAAIGGAFEVIRRKTSWRTKSNSFYAHRDDIDQLLSRMRYELPQPLNPDHIAMIAREYREKKLAWGKEMRKINDLIDEQAIPSHSSHSSGQTSATPPARRK